MDGKSKPVSTYALNVGGILLMLSVVGSTLRFMVISVTLIAWVQSQWMRYVSILEQRRSTRLSVIADEARIQRRKQISDIAGIIGENVIEMLEQRRELVIQMTQEAEKKRCECDQEISRRIIHHVAAFQESEKAKDQELKALRSLYKKFQKQERKSEEKRDHTWEKIPEQENYHFQNYQVAQPATNFNAVVSSLPNYTLPSDLLRYSDDLKSYFTCIGVTKKGTRCGQKMISNADKSAAAARIAKMSSSNPGDTYELQSLQELAEWMLCPRWHRDKIPQGEDIAIRWYEQLSDARAKLKGRESSHTNMSSVKRKLFTTPSSTSTLSSPSSSAFSAASRGSSSNVSSIQSYTTTGYQFTHVQEASAAVERQSFGSSARRNLTPLFESMARPS